MTEKLSVYIPVYIKLDHEYGAWVSPQINSSVAQGLVLSAEEIRKGNAAQIAAKLNELIASSQPVYFCRNKENGFDHLFLQNNWHQAHPGVFILTLDVDVEQVETIQEEITTHPSEGGSVRVNIDRDRFKPKAKIGLFQLQSLEERVQLLQSDKNTYLPGQIKLKYTVVPSDKQAKYKPGFQFSRSEVVPVPAENPSNQFNS